MKIPENFFRPSKSISYEDYTYMFKFGNSYNKKNYLWYIYSNTDINLFHIKSGDVIIAKMKNNTIQINEDFKKFFNQPIIEKFNLREEKLKRILNTEHIILTIDAEHISPTTTESTK